MKGQLFLTGCIRSGTNWVFDVLAKHYEVCHSEYFDYLDLKRRENAFYGCESLLFKINEDMRNLGLLEDAFPDGKIVVILRNPIEALHSIYKPDEESIPFRPFNDLETKWFKEGDSDRLPAAIRRLLSYFPDDALEKIKSPGPACHILRYEELLNDFDATIANLFAFCGITVRSGQAIGNRPLRTANQGVRLKNFSAEQQEIILSSDIPQLSEKMGYAFP